MTDFADGRMVVAQQGHHVFRVRALGEPGEPAKIAEERGNLPAMAFELFPPQTRRSDQLPAGAGSAAACSCARSRLLGRRRVVRVAG